METHEAAANPPGHEILHLRVLFDGHERPVEARPDTTVLEVIEKVLGPQRRGEADKFELVRRDGEILEPARTLGSYSIADREVLSLNKHDGGGGER